MLCIFNFEISDYKLPPQYQNNPVLMRGCFVLKVPDHCYTAKNGLSYCWCSQKDLCNAAFPTFQQSTSYLWLIIQHILVSHTSITPHSIQMFVQQNSISMGVGFQLFSSAFLWYTYNRVIHCFFFPRHENIL